MAELLITGIDSDSIAEIARRAAARKQTVESVARDILVSGLKLDRETRLRLAAEARAMTLQSGGDSTAIIRALRDRAE